MGTKTIQLYIQWTFSYDLYSGLKIATNIVANATDIFSLVTKNLLLATPFLLGH